MLVITRSGEEKDRSIFIYHAGERIELRVWRIKSGRVKASFKGPESFRVYREEIAEQAMARKEQT